VEGLAVKPFKGRKGGREGYTGLGGGEVVQRLREVVQRASGEIRQQHREAAPKKTLHSRANE
jgi:hypothetical protein